MKKIKLTQSQIEDLLKIEDPFKKRDYIQEKGIELFKETKGQLLVTWATSIGKTVFAIKIIKRIRKNSLDPIHITVPTINLLNQWKEQLKDIPNVEVYTIMSYSKLENPSPLLLISDEVYIGLANENAESYNKINMFNSTYKLYLSATLKNDQKKFIERVTGIKTEFNFDVSEALLLGFIPEFKIYNIYVSFTEEEKVIFKKALIQENKCIQYFNYLGYNKRPDLKKFPVFLDPKTKKDITNQAKIMALQWFSATSKRCNVIYNAKNKSKVVNEILPYLKRKTLLFSKTTKMAQLLSKENKIDSYHSGVSSKKGEYNLKRFLNNEISFLSSVNKLIAGFDDEVSECIFRHSFSSTSLSGTQSLGKILPK